MSQRGRATGLEAAGWQQRSAYGAVSVASAVGSDASTLRPAKDRADPSSQAGKVSPGRQGCPRCARPIPVGTRSHAVWCSPTCRRGAWRDRRHANIDQLTMVKIALEVGARALARLDRRALNALLREVAADLGIALPVVMRVGATLAKGTAPGAPSQTPEAFVAALRSMNAAWSDRATLPESRDP
jgi:hypothetical protein